jgi:hypothetical protein
MAQALAIPQQGGMGKYFFDFYDGKTVTKDDDGVELEDLDAARIEALRVLPEIARYTQIDGHALVLTVTVRTETDPVVFISTLTLAAIKTA